MKYITGKTISLESDLEIGTKNDVCQVPLAERSDDLIKMNKHDICQIHSESLLIAESAGHITKCTSDVRRECRGMGGSNCFSENHRKPSF